MVKYKEMFKQMCEENQELFENFAEICDRYSKEREKYKEEFDSEGKLVLRVVGDWERKLCGKMESGNKAKYSANLSDKFWGEVRILFPLIDEVGVKKSFVK